MSKLVLYTTHCPKCCILEKKLQSKGVDYITCTDIETMKSLGIEYTPILDVDGTLLSFAEAVAYVNKLGE